MWMSFFSFQIYSRDNVWIYGDRNALRWDWRYLLDGYLATAFVDGKMRRKKKGIFSFSLFWFMAFVFLDCDDWWGWYAEIFDKAGWWWSDSLLSLQVIVFAFDFNTFLGDLATAFVNGKDNIRTTMGPNNKGGIVFFAIVIICCMSPITPKLICYCWLLTTT